MPALWRGETAVLLGGGPSLTQEAVDRCRGRARVLAINDAVFLAPWADLHYVCDGRWLAWHAGDGRLDKFAGLRATLDEKAARDDPSLRWLRNDDRNGRAGLSERPDAIKTGRNGGYQAIGLAVHLGATRLLLLGYDMRAVAGRTHWFGDHPTATGASIYETVMRPGFATLPAPLAARGVEVVNCTPGSALTVFPRLDLEAALCRRRTAYCPTASPTAVTGP